MSDALPLSTFQCTQCGGELRPDEGQIFLTCPYCNSTVYLDRSKVVFHWYVNPTLDVDKARGALNRWMAGNHTVKDLDKKSRITDAQFAYFPLWYFKRVDNNGRERITLRPAAATAVTEISHMQLPAGDLRKYEDRLDADAQSPSVPLDAALDWLTQDKKLPDGKLAETALVHVPIYTFKYDFNGRGYTALVEGSGGGVMANIFPEKAEAPYQLVAGLTAVTFLCLASLPVGGAVMGEDAGFMGTAICIVAGLPFAVIYMALAAWVAQRV